MNGYFSKMAVPIKDYMEFRTAIGRSRHYERHMELFDQFCVEYYPDSHSLTKEVVRGWISNEIALGRGQLRDKISAIRLFAQYLGNGAYVLPRDFIADKTSFIPYIFTDDELAALFNAADNLPKDGRRDPFLSYTIPVLLRFLYSCGLRPNEGRLVKRSNICFETGEILIIKTKCHKERIVVMSDDMLELCKKYDTQRRVASIRSDYFFVRMDSTPIPTNQLCLLFKHCWIQANPGIPTQRLPRVRPYDLRHRYASAVLQKWLDEGRNLYAMLPYLRAYMGHEDFQSTAYYIHILPENLLKSSGIDWNKLDNIGPGVDVWES